MTDSPLAPRQAQWCRNQWPAFREMEAAKIDNRWEIDAQLRAIRAANRGEIVKPGFQQEAA